MDIEMFREYCLSKVGVEESLPFDEHTLVFKVGNKIFALTSLNRDPAVNLKCNPERAIELREHHSSIIPGYHMSKKHWNTVILDGSISDALLIELIDHSYTLVFNSLTKKVRDQYAVSI